MNYLGLLFAARNESRIARSAGVLRVWPRPVRSIRALTAVAMLAFGASDSMAAGASRDATGDSRSKNETPERVCPTDTVCMAIPPIGVSTRLEKNKEQVMSSAIPSLLQIALLKFPGIQLVSSGELWRALRATYDSPADWRPANLSDPKVLHRAGANYVLQGQLFERQGSIQLLGRIRSLIDEDRWSSRTLRSRRYAERQLFEGVSAFAGQIVQALADAEKLDYHQRKFITSDFCDASNAPSKRSDLYAKDLAKALQ